MDTSNKFIAVGMRAPIAEPGAMVINTCSGNDTDAVGDSKHWTWTNPTNRAIVHKYADVGAVSVECLWQGTKIWQGMTRPDQDILNGNWRRGKGKKPIGAWAGGGVPLIRSPGEARRKIYLPAYENLIRWWLAHSEEARTLLAIAKAHEGHVYLRDFDTGQGIDRNGPMSHAWLLSTWLNDGKF